MCQIGWRSSISMCVRTRKRFGADTAPETEMRPLQETQARYPYGPIRRMQWIIDTRS